MTAKQSAVKKYMVTLSHDERERLETMIRAGKHPAWRSTRARILKADAAEGGDGWSDSQIAAALDISAATVAQIRQQLLEEGFEAVLERKHSPASARPRIFYGASEAKLIALACSEPPKRRKRWTLKLLEEKNILKPHLQKQWVIPPDANAAFVAGMEDVLEVYHRPHDPTRPVVCLDESSKQLVAETRLPIPAKSGCPARYDYEYDRNGTANLFMVFAPLEGWREVKVTDHLYRGGLRPGPQIIIQYALSQGRENPARAG